jgi:hypothetical protein
MERAAENPSSTPPHKGEGLDLPHSLRAIAIAASCSNARCFARECREVSPSPLWGGVGEGFSKGDASP